MLAKVTSNYLSSFNAVFILKSPANFLQAKCQGIFIFLFTLFTPLPVQFIKVSYSFSLATTVTQATVISFAVAGCCR